MEFTLFLILFITVVKLESAHNALDAHLDHHANVHGNFNPYGKKRSRTTQKASRERDNDGEGKHQ